MRDPIDAFIHDTLLINDPGELKRYFIKFLAGYKIDAVAYYQLVDGFKRLSPDKGFRISTFPEDFIRYYLDHNCFDDDPVIEKTLQSSIPFHWSEVTDRPDLKTDTQKEYMTLARASGLLGGVIAPVYARPGDIAYFSLGSTTTELKVSRAALLELQAICQQMHSRYKELTRKANPPKLSKRETQVLELIARGKSNIAISEELGVSPNTIDTLVRRCFEKLGVSSRVEAALAGVSMGIIMP